MILDENLVVPIEPITISHKGEKVTVKNLILKHPTPSMAKDTFKMRRYFVAMQKESEKAVLGSMSPEAAKELIALAEQQRTKLEAGDKVESLHKEYSDDNEQSRDGKIAEIAKMETGFMQMLDMCEGVDFYAMTVDFGKMLLSNKRCSFQCNEEGEPDDFELMKSGSVWTDQIDPRDRLEAAVKYCCFFGLTSNSRKRTG